MDCHFSNSSGSARKELFQCDRNALLRALSQRFQKKNERFLVSVKTTVDEKHKELISLLKKNQAVGGVIKNKVKALKAIMETGSCIVTNTLCVFVPHVFLVVVFLRDDGLLRAELLREMDRVEKLNKAAKRPPGQKATPKKATSQVDKEQAVHPGYTP